MLWRLPRPRCVSRACRSPPMTRRPATRMINRLRWHLHRIAPGDPAADPAPASLDVAKTRRALTGWLAEELAARPSIDARLARDVLADIDRVCAQVSALDKEITTAVRAHEAATRLTALPGCAALTAAKIVGE